MGSPHDHGVDLTPLVAKRRLRRDGIPPPVLPRSLLIDDRGTFLADQYPFTIRVLISVIILSLICLVSGCTLAGIAPKRPRQQALLESVGGCLIVLGLCLVGADLPLFR